MTHGAFILARYSTENQNEDSIEVQVKHCTDYCNSHSLTVLDVFADYHTSGMKNSRPEYERMMAALRAGGADHVVIYDQSRMFRRMTAWFDFREELEKLGVTVISVTQPMIGGDLRDPANFLTEGATALFSQMWALQTRQKVMTKMRYMAEHGQHTGGTPPLGYRVEEGRYQIEPSEASTVRLIFELAASGTSYREIIAELNRRGLTTKSGKPFGSNSIYDLLRNRKYIGVLTYGRVPHGPDGKRNHHNVDPSTMISVENAVPAIVPRELFEEVQKKMNDRKYTNKGRPSENREYPLRGKVFCGLCGSSLSVTVSSGKYYYYSCSGKKRLHNCDLMPISCDSLENSIAATLRSALQAPGKLDELITILRAARSEMMGPDSLEMIRHLTQRYADLSKQIDNATDAILSGLNSPALAQRLQALEKERSDIDKRLTEAKKSYDGAQLAESDLRSLLEETLSSARSDNASVLSLVTRVELYPDKILVWTLMDIDPSGRPLDRDEILSIDNNSPPAPPAPPFVITSCGNLVFLIPR